MARGGVRRAARIAWKVFCYTLGILVVAALAVQLWFFAHVLWWRSFQPEQSAFMAARVEQLRAKDPKAKLAHQWVALRAHLVAAEARGGRRRGRQVHRTTRASTGKRFPRRSRRTRSKGRVVSGASTISQQLAKNLFLSGERSWLRKGQEAVITWMLESALSKRRILELYLNYAEWGEGVFGAEAAARYHFGVNAAALSAPQAAFLAAILPSPRRYAPGRITPYVAGRIETILARMPAAQIPR